MNKELVQKVLEEDEGRRKKVYKDSLGILSIGVGRNLEGKGLSDKEIDFLLDNDILDAEVDLRDIFPNFFDYSDRRQAALISMMFMGVGSFKTFKNMIARIKEGNWEEAAEEVKNSKYAKQVGERADRIAAAFREG